MHMPVNIDPCELHQVSNCSVCSGLDQRFNDTLTELEASARRPFLAGGPTINAKFPGRCAGCGRGYEADELIHHSREHDGWVLVECCAAQDLGQGSAR